MTHIIPARLLRPQADMCLSKPPLTPRAVKRLEYILEAACNMFVAHGRAGVTLKEFSYAIAIGVTAIRHAALDMDEIFRLILSKHLEGLTAALNLVPADRADTQYRRRAEYLRYTRNENTALTGLHRLFVQQRFALPEDAQAQIEKQRRLIGIMVGGNDWEAALALLDTPGVTQARLEAMLPATPSPEKNRAGLWGAATPPNLASFLSFPTASGPKASGPKAPDPEAPALKAQAETPMPVQASPQAPPPHHAAG